MDDSAYTTIGLGVAVISAALRIVKIPEPIGWATLGVGVAIMGSPFLPEWAKPSIGQTALYLVGIAAILAAASWQISAQKVPEAAKADPKSVPAAAPQPTAQPQARDDRAATLQQLTDLYIGSNDGITPRMFAGLELPPIKFLNEELAKLKKPWRVKSTDGPNAVTYELLR